MKNIMMIAFAITILVSCKKDEPPATIKPVEYPVYGNLKTGNYWTYQHFKIDTNGVATPLNIFDTCYIEKDTIIHDSVYFKMIRPRLVQRWNYVYYWREFQGNIYDTTGKICFSAEDFTSILDTVNEFHNFNGQIDTIYVATSKMIDKDLVFNTPAGDFVTRTHQTKYELGQLFNHDIRLSTRRFSKDIGIVAETLDIYASDPNYVERRLVSFGTK